MKPADFKKQSAGLSPSEIVEMFSDERAARFAFEQWRWPDGIKCPHCGCADEKRFSKVRPNPKVGTRSGIRFCGVCRKQFTATMGTILHDTHLPLQKWMIGFHIFFHGRENGTAMILHQMLGVSYLTAWRMARRIRFVMGMKMTVHNRNGRYIGKNKKQASITKKIWLRRRILKMLWEKPAGLSMKQIHSIIQKERPEITLKAICSMVGQNSMRQFVFSSGIVKANENRLLYWNELLPVLEMNRLGGIKTKLETKI